MHKGDLIITNKTRRRVVKSMQVLLEELAIPEQGNEQLLTALRTAWAKELSLDKNVSVYSDALDALRLALRA